MKRGLFVCYDPHALMQFLQFYCMGDFPAEWDVLCLPVENGEEYMHSYCEKAGLFKNIFVGNVEYMNLPFFKKLGLFLYMFFFAIIGLRKKCCAKILNEYVGDINQYEILCSNIDTGFISGMLASFGKEKDVVYFEDGALDYNVFRLKWKTAFYPVLSLMNIQCVIMARLGYFAKNAVFFNPTKFCIKYVTNKNELTYKNYKEIREFILSDLQISIFTSIQRQLFPELSNLDFSDGQPILFTTPFTDIDKDVEKFYDKIIYYMSNISNVIYIKKHPRDNTEYCFSDNIKVVEIPKSIPSEILYPLLNNNLCYFMNISSSIIGLKPFVSKIKVFYIKDMNDKFKNKYTSLNIVKNYLERFMKDKYEIIEL